jgi:hypothetical protein
MVNGDPWENPHSQTRTTKGKDLDKMTPEDLSVHLKEFEKLITEYLDVNPFWILNE